MLQLKRRSRPRHTVTFQGDMEGNTLIIHATSLKQTAYNAVEADGVLITGGTMIMEIDDIEVWRKK